MTQTNQSGASSCLESSEAPAWIVSVVALSVGAAIVLSVSLWYLWKGRDNICKCGDNNEEGQSTECRAEKRISVAAVGNNARRMSNVDSGNTNSILAGLQGGEDDVGGMDVIEEDEVIVDEANGGLCDELAEYGENGVVLESLTGRDVEVGVVNSDEEDMGYESHETLEDQNDRENDHDGVIVNNDGQDNAEEKETVEEEIEKEEEDVTGNDENVGTQDNGESNVETLDQQQEDHDHIKEPEEMVDDLQQDNQQKENELESASMATEENELESVTITTEENELTSVTKAAEENELESAIMITEENELESAAEENELETATMATEENELESLSKTTEENELESVIIDEEENELKSITIERGRKESNSDEREVLAALADSVRGTEDSSTEDWDSESGKSQSEEKSKSVEDSDSDDDIFARLGNNSDVATEILDPDLENVEVQSESPNNSTGDVNDDIPVDWND